MATRLFSFNPNTHNLWEIYEAIHNYYPIGLSRDSAVYMEYKGIKELEKLVVENIHDKENYLQRWDSFTTQIGAELDKEVVGTTFGQAPSFSSSIILKKDTIQSCTHSKELHFSVSLLGNFYQIYGIDATTIDDVGSEYNKRYYALNVITTSPYKEFENAFKFVEYRIKDKFPGYKIIPFEYGQTLIKGLQVRYIDDEDCSINKALFNHFLSKDNIIGSIRGDRFYGKDQWLKT